MLVLLHCRWLERQVSTLALAGLWWKKKMFWLLCMTTIVQLDSSVYQSASQTAVCYYKIPVHKETLKISFKPFLSALGVVSKWFHSEFIHHYTIDWTYKYTASRGWSWTVQFTRAFVFVKNTNHGKQFCNENRIRILLTSNSFNRSVMDQSCSTVLHTDCQADSQTEVRYLHHSFTWWKQTVIFNCSICLGCVFNFAIVLFPFYFNLQRLSMSITHFAQVGPENQS